MESSCFSSKDKILLDKVTIDLKDQSEFKSTFNQTNKLTTAILAEKKKTPRTENSSFNNLP